MVVRWTRTAEKDLDLIYSFYGGSSMAKTIIANIRKGALRLEIFPLMAPIELSLEDFPHTYHSLVVMKLFKIVYFVDEIAAEVIIVDIWDCRQDPDMLRKRIGK